MLFIGTKLGMTRVYNAAGVNVPVTVIKVDLHVVTELRSVEKHGYTGVQVASGKMKARNSTFQMIGHDAKAGSDPLRHHREFRCTPAEAGNFTLGQTYTVKELEGFKFVDVVGRSKGKGFQGTMKRHNFKGMFATHGTERKHRSPGSIGSLCSNRGYGGGLKKGKRMAGHMGDERVTVRSLDVVRVDAENGLILVKGPVPGANSGTVLIRKAVRLHRAKAKLATA